MESGNQHYGRVNHVIYICSVSLLYGLPLVPVETDHIKSVVRPIERYSERLIFIVSADSTDASLHAIE